MQNSRFPTQVAIVGSADLELHVSLPRIPGKSEGVFADGLRVRLGGRAAEVAAMLGRMGARVFFYTCLGIDPFGVRVLTELRRERVNVDFVERLRDVSTGIVHHFETPDGAHRMVHTPGAAMHMTTKGLRLGKAMLSSCDLMVLYPDIPEEPFELALQMAHHFRVPVMVDPTPVGRLAKKYVQHIDVLTPNRLEAETITESRVDGLSDGFDVARRLLRMGAGAVAVTLGATGMVMGTDVKSVQYVPAPKVRTADTNLRHGDVFISMLAFLLAMRKPFDEACREALVVAAHTDRSADSLALDLKPAENYLRMEVE